MILKIEDGILLKPYALAYKKDGWGRMPPGWTPHNLDQIEAMVLSLPDDGNKSEAPVTRQSAFKHFADEAHALRRPWRGWLPVSARADRGISKAYRQLFIEMNPEFNDGEIKLHARTGTLKGSTEWPPDGLYSFTRGKMHLVERDISEDISEDIDQA